MAKSLKEQNRWQLWIIIAVNTVLLFTLARTDHLDFNRIGSIFTNVNSLLPAGVALVIATLLNGLLSADIKARLVFLRWHNALPGHRAFTKLARTDPRVDFATLSKQFPSGIPSDPQDQNRAWYRLYKRVEKTSAVAQVHRDFLLMRDYTALSVLFFLFYGFAAVYSFASWHVCAMYFVFLLVQYLAARQAAARYGERLVTTVLAISAVS